MYLINSSIPTPLVADCLGLLLLISFSPAPGHNVSIRHLMKFNDHKIQLPPWCISSPKPITVAVTSEKFFIVDEEQTGSKAPGDVRRSSPVSNGSGGVGRGRWWESWLGA